MTEYYKFENIPLPYAYDALEPYIDTLTMHLHHDRHLQTYVDNLNAALAQHPTLQNLTLKELLCNTNRMPKATATPIARNAGGVYNHQFYFEGMAPNAQKQPLGELATEITKTFGSFEHCKKKMQEAALAVFGSGYAWLVADKRGRVSIMTTANQDTPLTMGVSPILNLDVWEHAYYLKHFNKRVDYIADWFEVADWKKASERYFMRF